MHLKASVLRQNIGDDALAAIRPVGADRTKTYEEIKAPIVARFQPAYSELLLHQQFTRCTMAESQSSREVLQTLWEAIRRTSCKDAEEQLFWVLTIFTTRHMNAEIRRAFELKPPTTEKEALQIIDDIESKQRKRTATEKINAVLQETGLLQAQEVANMDAKGRRGNSNVGCGGGGGFRGCGGGQQTGQQGGNDCKNCGGSAKCRSGHCPAMGAVCFNCNSKGHLSRVCPDNRNPQGGQERRNNERASYQNRAVHKYDAAGSGYGDRRDVQRAREDNLHPSTTYADQGAVGFFPLEQSKVTTTYSEVHHNQMNYLQGLARAANQSPTIQRTPKSAAQPVDSVHVQFEPTSINKTGKVSTSQCNHDVWMEPVMLGRKQASAKVDTGARVNVSSFSG